jgi:hypothetical protein
MNQIEFLIFLRERSMLGEARGTVTQVELKLMILFYIISFFLFCIFLFIKPRFR